ncbi:tRNA (adenosine(37)-N6)-threonylcarbamoyltransferase complex dimerization subunit type 1 TsaB [Flavonifractor plautii]|nr:tRNA (adenosine(37)-N6)-threonylcarbamoyltransferase complex dimerization subunit type 1 TsaB [Flavonifractor plautii]
MKILALESSATACSVALCEDEALIAQSFQNNGLTHSRTLMPMAVSLLDNCGTALDAVELIAVAAGPGSFTGLRIGVAAAKGLAWPGNKPCAACSTLESMAWCLAHLDGGDLCSHGCPPEPGLQRPLPCGRRPLGAPVPRPGRGPGRPGRRAKKERESAISGWRRRTFMLYYPQGTGVGHPAGASPPAAPECLGGCPVCTGADQSGQADRRGRTDAQLPPALPSGTGAAGKRTTQRGIVPWTWKKYTFWTTLCCSTSCPSCGMRTPELRTSVRWSQRSPR